MCHVFLIGEDLPSVMDVDVRDIQVSIKGWNNQVWCKGECYITDDQVCIGLDTRVMQTGQSIPECQWMESVYF